MTAVTALLCSTLMFVGAFVLVSADQKIIIGDSGQDVIMPCRVPDNNIAIIVKWNRDDSETPYVFLYRDGHVVPDDQHPSFKNRVDLQDRQMKDGDVSLILKDVTINDTGTYECRVFIEETRSWKLSSIINLIVPPDQKIITAESRQNVTLPCKATEKNIKVVKWRRPDLGDDFVLLYHDGWFDHEKQHPSFKNRVDLQDRQMKDGDVSLILKDVTTADAGTYKCHVFIEETRSWKLSNIIYLRFSAEDKAIKAESGQNIALTCRAPNNNFTVVEWSRADIGDAYVLLYQEGPFDANIQHPSFKNRVDLQDRQMKDGDVSLILKNVTINDTGTYKCRVFMRETQSWQLIRITYLSVPPEEKIITAEPGQDVTLTCRAPNNNKIVVNWTRTDLKDKYVFLYRDGQFPPTNQHPSFKNRVDLLDRQMKDGDVSLILKDVTTADTGTYECRVFMEKKYSGEPTVIFLRVAPPGQTGGGKKESGSVWLAVGLSVSAVILVAAVGLSIFRKRHQQSQNSYLPPVEMQSF